MVSLREAISIARELWDEFDEYSEYDTCYLFSKHEEPDEPEMVSGEGPIAVMKDTGQAVNFIWALTNDLFGDIEADGMKESLPLPIESDERRP